MGKCYAVAKDETSVDIICRRVLLFSYEKVEYDKYS
jgi:hypothetical protein